MSKALASCLSVLVCATSLVSARAQESPPPRSGATTLFATERYLFVLHEGVLRQFDIDTLALRNQVNLASARAPARTPAPSSTPSSAPQSNRVSATETAAPPVVRVSLRPETRKGPSAATMATVVQRAIDWLVRHQDQDGKWDADGFMKHDVEGDVCDGPGSAVHDVGATGLAVLALLADGSNMRAGKHRDAVKKGVSWLREQQQENGLFGTMASHDFIYDHAIATLAVCQAYGLSDYKLLKPVAQKGLDYLESHRNPYSVWRYQPRDNDNDSSVTAWCLLACIAGDNHGLHVNKNALSLGGVWFDQVTSPTGHAGYTKQGERSSRQPGDHAMRFPVEKGEAMTAAALYCRHMLGQSPEQKPVMRAAADLLLEKPPSWQPKAGTIDEYCWYFGTLALAQSGGRHWRDWSRHLAEAVAGAQQQDGNVAGSWDPIGVWGEQGGRVCSTAMLAMAASATGAVVR